MKPIMRRRELRKVTERFLLGLGLVLCSVCAWGQKPNVADKLGYPQTILYNGKIVTMDDASFEPRVGTIAQGMAIRDGKILATGTNADIRALAGPQTKSMDLNGRVVLPGFITTHDHPHIQGFDQEITAFRHALPGDDVVISRYLDSKPFREQFAQFEPMLREAVSKARAGQWIRFIFNVGRDYQWTADIRANFVKSLKKEWLDQLAPNNPLVVRSGSVDVVVNQRAIDALREVHLALPATEVPYFNSVEGLNGFQVTRWYEPDAMFHGKLPLLAEVLKSELELWASWGFTSIGSTAYSHNVIQALDHLDKKGEMPSRFGWGYIGPDLNLEVLRYFAGMLGHGTEHLWFVGMYERIGGDCSTAPVKSEWLKTHQLGAAGTWPCNFEPGSIGREILDRIIATGNRVATFHTWGDKDIDYYLDAIEQASQKAGMTLDEIRAKRHSLDHAVNGPRPDQLPRMKKLGMVASLNHTYIWGWQAAFLTGVHGIEYTSWMAPRKSMTEAGIMTTFEMDKALPNKVFLTLLKGIDRYSDLDQKVYGPDQKVDRTIQLKALTRWGAYYLLRENMLGTLEPGKGADFVVLDRDILTVPENQIPNIRVLMTVVGGKPVHLAASLASELGMQPVGPTTWKESVPPGW